jgi:hypothetical protein
MGYYATYNSLTMACRVLCYNISKLNGLVQLYESDRGRCSAPDSLLSSFICDLTQDSSPDRLMCCTLVTLWIFLLTLGLGPYRICADDSVV